MEATVVEAMDADINPKDNPDPPSPTSSPAKPAEETPTDKDADDIPIIG